MSVSDEAVYAALEAFWKVEDYPSKEAMRAALDAAAPLMLAAAWDEGAAMQAEWSYTELDPGPNPYRYQNDISKKSNRGDTE